MKFHFNEVALRHTAQSRLPDREGRLQYRSSKGGYKERWFRLQGNLLFYFRTNEFGSIADHDPIGVFVLAQFSVELEPISDRPFVFTITFAGEEGRKHYFSGQTMQQCHDWMDALQQNSYEAVRMKFESIRREVQRLTGKDPITEKMATNIKQKVKSSVGTLAGSGQDSRRTKFYYDDGVSSKRDVLAASSAPAEKPVRPPEASKTKLVSPLDSMLVPGSNAALPSQEKPLVEDVLVSLSLEDSSVPKNPVQPSITQMPQTTTQSDMCQDPLQPRGSSQMPLVQMDVSQMPTPQSGISKIQQEQLSNFSQMPGISRKPLGKPVASQMPFMQPGTSQWALVQSSISQMPLLQSGISHMPAAPSGFTQVPQFKPLNTRMPVVQPGNSQLSTAQSGISEMPLMQPGINQLSLMQPHGSQMPSIQPGISQMPASQSGISKMPFLQPSVNQLSLIQPGGSRLPVTHPSISQTPLVPLSGMADTTSVLMTNMSTMQMPLTMRPRSAQTSDMHRRNAVHKPQTSSDDKFQAHHISKPSAVSCWPLEPLQRTGKSHTTPELTSFEKWEKFDE